MNFLRLLVTSLVLLAASASSAWSQFTPFCYGDTTSGPCPCANISTPSSGGCLNSLASPGLLVASSPTGFARVTGDIQGIDRVTLTGSGMPNSACIYFQGSATLPVLFGDGIRCVNNPFQVQLGTRTNVGGTSFVGGAPGPAIALQGALNTPLVAPVTRAYQCWYRNAAAFCTPATFNLTNAVSIQWFP
ncbi:MAG: hypothetical protein NTY35_13075 [Planctomycetota bacterium]|nr:hypothetical protein [Planctomycetota bacterium]